MGGQHNLEKKFLHVANEVNQMHQKCQSLFLLGGEEERQLDIFWIFIFPVCSMVSQHAFNVVAPLSLPNFQWFLDIPNAFFKLFPKTKYFILYPHHKLTKLHRFAQISCEIRFHTFVEKLQKFYVVVNIKDICTYSIF
jgi:hypothetical protein